MVKRKVTLQMKKEFVKLYKNGLGTWRLLRNLNEDNSMEQIEYVGIK